MDYSSFILHGIRILVSRHIFVEEFYMKEKHCESSENFH